MIGATPQRAKIGALEGLRGIMAWWVVLGHVSLAFDWHVPLINNNTLAVDVFIVLSGFVIARLIDRKAEAYVPFITRRAFRLFPLYLVVLAVSVALLRVQLGAWADIPIQNKMNVNRFMLAQEATQNLLPHVLAHIPLAQGLIPNALLASSPYTLVGQAWSISLEWQFYLLAPFFMWAATSRRGWIAGIVSVVALSLASKIMPGGFLGDKIAHFGIGIASYLAFDRPGERHKWLAVAAAFAAIAIARGGGLQFIPIVLWAAVLWSASTLPHALGHALARFLSSKFLTHLGDVSYSVYLVHMVPLYCSIFVLTRAGASIIVLQSVALLSTIIGTYILARLSYVTLEKPGIALGARIVQRFS
ncbi:acyltransferase [Sphingomonas sp. PP-CC-3A-396]|uniref:acyltransferase family protein n=1 Tax=Sphingomonas sp. PP-CC-3A-396 TaxID=2135655 RepID=UPI0010E81CD3|nr:acyltransferase [Sphingomonas sp. PP-CC-3A-396]TCQ03005.1 peptidoglycan/LPS O-acetylase OafA/YrhL [Sphingomonas sp. PP-CC-3A-396]